MSKWSSSFLIVIIGTTLIGFPMRGHATETQERLATAQHLFGRQVQGHPHLFEVNDEYVLSVDLDELGEIRRLEVLPKYFFQGLMPDWKEPKHVVGLSPDEYFNLLRKATQLKAFGPIISVGKVGAVTNSKLWLLDEYQSAFLQRRLNRTVQDTATSTETVHSFSIYYIRAVEGVVDDKQEIDEFGAARRFRVRVDGCSYLTSKLQFAKAKKGKRALIYAAGPLDESDCFRKG